MMRWTAKRKAEVVQQIASGQLGVWEAIEKYGLTWEELTGWEELFKTYGIKGLRTTRLQIYRR